MPNEIEAVFIANLRSFIEVRGYKSVEKFAWEHGLSKGGIGKILQGKRIPRFDTAVRLAQALDITLNDLYPLDGKSYPVSQIKKYKLDKVKAAQKLLLEVLEVGVPQKRKK